MIDYLAFIPPAGLPPNAATETTLAALKSKVDGTLSIDKSGLATAAGQADILAQLQGDRAIASQVFTDSTGTVYLKALAFNSTTNTYESTTLTLAGAPYTPTPPETPISASDLDTVELTWEIITAGTGYAVGNFVSQYNFIRQGPPPVIVATLWVNEGVTIAAPPASHRRKVGSSGATEATLGQLKTSLELQARLTDSQPVELRAAGGAVATGSGAANAQTLRVVQSSDDILRLRALTPRKPAAITLTTTTAVDLIPAPSNPAHRHIICWLCGQNATDTATVAEFTGGAVPIKAVAPIKGSGIDRAADPQVLTLNAGAAFRVGQNVATTFEASCGYYTIDAAGAPV